MTINGFQAAKTLSELSKYTLSHLNIQRILFISHMCHLGLYKTPLIHETFESWDYGPIIPELYNKLKYGNHPIKPWKYKNIENVDKTISEYNTLYNIYQLIKNKSDSQLVSLSHGNSWGKHYKPGFNFKISNKDIFDEYHERLLK